MTRKFKSNHKQYKKKNGSGIYKQFEEIEKREKELEKKSFMETVSSGLKIPNDVLVGAPILMATGKNILTIENFRGIIEYNGSVIRVQTKTCKICIEGKNMNIDYYTDEEMRVSGIIQCIRYI